MSIEFLERNHAVPLIAPDADIFDGDPASRPVRLSAARELTALLHILATTGTAKIQVQACDNEDGDNPVAIPFRYRKSADASDEFGAITNATAADGFTTAVSGEYLYEIFVVASEIHETAAALGKGFVRIKATEVVNAAVIGSLMAVLSKMHFEQETPDTVLE